ncbi:MAG: hypothetical protein KAI99_10220, partial [Cyclobacteriaceae bacterium]|nr:hypothetical protein [Cyclobacteriaceae bacterium]
MKTRGLIDFYLPSKIAYHLKIALASILIAMFFNTMWTGKPFNENFWIMLGLLFVQLEIYMAIAFRVFSTGSIKTGKTYKKQIIIKLIKFYLLVLLIATGIIFVTLTVIMFLGDQSFSDILNHFIQKELKGASISGLIGIS